MARKLHLIFVGKLPHEWISLEQQYKKRISLFNLEIHEIKSSPNSNDPLLKNKISDIMRREKSLKIFLLDELGETYNSKQFATLIKKNFETGLPICLVIGGAYGLSADIKNKYTQTISFSKLTFTHQMARVLLIEQIYRAQTIITGHPYHH